MLKYDHLKQFANAGRLGAAFCALAAMGGGAAHAQATIVIAPFQLTNTVQTSPFPQGNVGGILGQVAPSFTVSAGPSDSVTISSSKSVSGVGFESAIANANDGPQFTAGDRIENTFVAVTNPDGNVTNQITGPITLSFSNGVTGFGLYAQDANSDVETFSLSVFNGNTLLSVTPFVFAPQDNFSTARGNAVFVGALSNAGPLITSAILSSASNAPGTGGNPTNGSNDFFFGPVQVQVAKPVPEASTFVSLGVGVLLFGGLVLSARKRKNHGASAAA